jgi:ribosomal protein S18 acetylase RimI-like enzyme
MIVRSARASDAEAIAELHAESWSRAYRGILRDEYLDGPVMADRRQVWADRLLSGPVPETMLVSLIEEESAIIGFVSVFLDVDPDWGALIDNLHVSVAAQGRGLGRRLMGLAAEWMLRQRPRSRLHLWVYERNTAARGFYQRLGGVIVGRESYHAPDGASVEVLQYGWENPSDLMPSQPHE